MKRWQTVGALVVTALAVSPANGFELKGFTPGMDVASLDLKGCERKADVDSGIPGYRCDTTLGGERASLRLAIFEGKVVAVIFGVEEGNMQALKDGLEEKYGEASQPNRYMQRFNWRKGPKQLSLDETIGSRRGYSAMIIDFDLMKRYNEVAKSKAKKDF